MAEILDNGESWKLVINTAAVPLDTADGYIDEFRTKGYRAQIGKDEASDKHVVMWVEYDKERNTLDDVAKKVDQLRTCGRCQTLDKKNLNLGKVRLGGDGQYQGRGYPGVSGTDIQQPQAPSAYAVELRKPTAVKDMFADMIFDAYFTPAGRYFLGMMTGDEELINSALPKTKEGMGVFVDQMLDFMTGEAEFVRSPEEAKEFLSALRSPPPDEMPGSLSARKNKKVANTGTVIY